MAMYTFLNEHRQLTRRFLLQLGGVGAAAAAMLPNTARGAEVTPELQQAIAKLEPFFTPAAEFRDVSRGNPVPHKLSDAKKAEVGLTRETWQLEVISDSEQPAKITPLTKAAGTAI